MRGRTILNIVLGVAVLYLSLCAGLYLAMLQPPGAFGRVMMNVPMPAMMVLPFSTLWKSARKGTIAIGEAAPAFSLPTLDHKNTVDLSSFRGSRPVVLIFGSYT